jgi:hypothetical protein
MEEMRNDYKVSVGKSQGKRSRRKPRSRWKDNIRMDLRALVSTTMNFAFPKRRVTS